MNPELTDLKSLKKEVVDDFKLIARDSFLSTKIFQGGASAFGACLAGIAQFVEGWSALGIVGVIILTAIALLNIFMDGNSAKTVARAYEAIEIAEEAQRLAEQARATDDDFQYFIGEYERNSATYQMMALMALALEQISRAPSVSEDVVATSLLESVGRMAPIGLGFAQADDWTICVYKAYQRADGRTSLRCIAHKRVTQCDLAEAREWESGTGIAGVAFANRNEVVVPDMWAAGLEAIYGSSANVKKPDDEDQYRSMAAVPVSLEGNTIWGVVTATSDQTNHFVDDRTELGMSNVEPLRALSKMIALGISCLSSRH